MENLQVHIAWSRLLTGRIYILRKVFLDKLPRKYGIGINKNKLCLDWENSIGYEIKFIYKKTRQYKNN